MVQEGDVAEHLIEHPGGPTPVGDTWAALVLGWAADAEPGDAIVVEALRREAESAHSGPAAGATQCDAAVGARRLLEVAAGTR
jgi:hypothetical protein